MSAEVFKFEEWAGSSRGLMARPVLPSDVIMVQANVAAIGYQVYNITDGGAPLTGTLDVLTVMKTSPQTWNRDGKGFTFLHEGDGSWWSLPGKVYRVVISFVTTPILGSKTLIEVWEVTTKDPAGA